MKWALALVVVVAAATIGTAVYVVLHNRDPVPNDITACVNKAGLTVAHNSAALNVARADVEARVLRPVRRWDYGRTTACCSSRPTAPTRSSRCRTRMRRRSAATWAAGCTTSPTRSRSWPWRRR